MLPALLWSTAVVVGLVTGWLAGRGYAPPQPEQAVAEPVGYRVIEGTVGSQLRFEAKGSWPEATLVWAGSGGVVTSMDVPTDGVVDEGDSLLSVDLRPVIAVEGKVPASRDLSRGVTGADVKQLQRFLAREGYQVAASQRFDAATERAVRAWQGKVGYPVDGVAHFGDVVFFGDLPARVGTSEGVVVGASVSAGAPLVEGIVGEAVVEVVASPEQISLIPADGEVVARLDGYEWPAKLRPAWTDADGQAHLPVVAVDGGPVCVDDCSRALPMGRATSIRLDVVEVPQTTGPIVPTSALRTDPSGKASVLSESGEPIPVEVIASHAGLAVVNGVEIGTMIMVFAQ